MFRKILLITLLFLLYWLYLFDNGILFKNNIWVKTMQINIPIQK